MTVSRTLTGTTRWMRSSDVHPEETKPCIEKRCRESGDGTHIFAYGVDLDGDADLPEYRRGLASQVHEAVRAMPENARIRITVEVVPNPDEHKPGLHGFGEVDPWGSTLRCLCGELLQLYGNGHDDLQRAMDIHTKGKGSTLQRDVGEVVSDPSGTVNP